MPRRSRPTGVGGACHTHVNKAEIDLVTDGDHDVRTDDPHGSRASHEATYDHLQIERNRVSAVLIHKPGSVELVSGMLARVDIKAACVIENISVRGGPDTGHAVLDVRRAAFAAWPTVASICGASKPTIVAARSYYDATLTGWTTTLAAGDVLEFYLESVSDFCDFSVAMAVRKS